MPAPFEIHSIEFLRTGGSIPLKDHGSGRAIQPPQYVQGGRNEPACYVAGAAPTLSVVLRKLSAYEPGAYTIGATGPLGGLPPKAVTPNFGPDGLSAPITFQLGQALPASVQSLSLAFAWTARRTSAPPGTTQIAMTTHRLFVVLSRPTKPWDSENPWVSALELACRWASGATNLDDAARLITEKYNLSGRVSYDTAQGLTHYGAANQASFNLTEMLERLGGGVGLGEKVNCTDSALTVSTLSNLLGCDLWQARMSGPNGFKLNPIQAIGYTEWKKPFAGGFSYHEVAWKGACSTQDRLFDGCLKIDGGTDPTQPPHTPLLPTNMVFGDCTAMNYRKRLASPIGCPNCQPQASSRRRRTLV